MTNLSKIRREHMLEFLNKLRDEHGDDDAIVAINEIEKELTSKKYGLIWEEHEERVDKEIETKVPVFSEELEREILTDPNLPYNFLIEGDNLHSLYLLEKTHKNSIDVILIDPPYNTGNKDFMYDDVYLAPDDDFKHSKWLSFMEKRLNIMYKLLSDSGIIIIHIDEHEFSQLKLLCDDLFGDTNYVGEFVWKARSGKGGTNSLIAIQHEYVLVYAKNFNKVNFRQDITITEEEKLEHLRQWGQGVYRADRPTMFFPILLKDGIFQLPTEEEYSRIYVDNEFQDDYLQELREKYESEGFEFILPYIDNELGRWRKGYYGVKELIESNSLVIVEDRTGTRYIKKIIPPDRESESAIDSLILDLGSASTGTLQLKELFDNTKVFDTTKPVEIEKFLLNLGVYNKPNAIILDCFAGSGTTGHAVMELNKEDGGNRRFILCTNNESGICEEVTYEKLKKLILGYDYAGKKKKVLFEEKITLKVFKQAQSVLEKANEVVSSNRDKYDSVSISVKDGVLSVIGTKEYAGRVEGTPANLKYYKTDYIEKLSEDENYNVTEELLKHIVEMVQLEHGIKIDDSRFIILLTDEDVDNLEQDEKRLSNCETIYLSTQVLLTSKQEALFDKLDIETILIPEYYFDRELREVGEL